MKATINGITIEGTPEEIHAYMQMQQRHEQGYQRYVKPYEPVTTGDYIYNPELYRVMCNQIDNAYSVSWPYAKS